MINRSLWILEVLNVIKVCVFCNMNDLSSEKTEFLEYMVLSLHIFILNLQFPFEKVSLKEVYIHFGIGRDFSMRKKGDLKFIQKLNQSIILNTIRNHGPISRSDIAKKTKLSPSTVTSAVLELIHEGIVVDGVVGQSSGRSRPTLVRF